MPGRTGQLEDVQRVVVQRDAHRTVRVILGKIARLGYRRTPGEVCDVGQRVDLVCARHRA
jgi:hypothetical protein